MSELEQHDISVLGLKPFHIKKLKRWSEAVGACAEEMLPSSSTVPSAALVSSTGLTVSDDVDHEEGTTESESDEENRHPVEREDPR